MLGNGYVYAVQSGEFVKIGVSREPERRLVKLQADCPMEAKLLGVIEGGYKLEKVLHKRFRKYHARGEWFHMQGPVLAWAENLSNVSGKEKAAPDGALAAWIFHNCLTDAAFGSLVGLSQSQISRIKRGKSRPSWEALAAIEKATKGKVTAADFMESGEAV